MDNIIIVPSNTPSTIIKSVDNPATILMGGESPNVLYMPAATREEIGAVKIGDGLNITVDGELSFDNNKILIDSISKNGEKITPDENKNVDIKLSKEDVGLDKVENASVTEKIAPLFEDITYNNITYTMTFKRVNGNTISVDLPLESTVQTGYYDDELHSIVLVLVSGDKVFIPVEDLLRDINDKVNYAVEVSESADDKSDEALRESKNAVEIANASKITADKATVRSNAAFTKAETAEATSNDAMELASASSLESKEAVKISKEANEISKETRESSIKSITFQEQLVNGDYRYKITYYSNTFSYLDTPIGPEGMQGIQGEIGLESISNKVPFNFSSVPVIGNTFTSAISSFNRTPVVNDVGIRLLNGSSSMIGRSWLANYIVKSIVSTNAICEITGVLETTGPKGEQGIQGEQGEIPQSELDKIEAAKVLSEDAFERADDAATLVEDVVRLTPVPTDTNGDVIVDNGEVVVIPFKVKIPTISLTREIGKLEGVSKAVNTIRCFAKIEDEFIKFLTDGNRCQIWLYIEQAYSSGHSGVGSQRRVNKKCYVHPNDRSIGAPEKLFTSDQYRYGGDPETNGWGIEVLNIRQRAWGQEDLYDISQSETGGFVPTEFEITVNHIITLLDGSKALQYDIPFKNFTDNAAYDGGYGRARLCRTPLKNTSTTPRLFCKAEIVINENGIKRNGLCKDKFVLQTYQGGDNHLEINQTYNDPRKVGGYII